MKRTATIAILTTLLAGASAATQAPGRAEVMLEAARQKETLEGDLKGAIRQYEEIVKKFAGDRAVSAKALIRMAECHQKLGDAEAQKIYSRVLREYADQKEAVAIARARVGKSGPGDTGIVVKQLLVVEGDQQVSAPSPDGRLLAFVSRGDVAVRDLETGEVRVLTKEATAGKNLPFAGANVRMAFSPDGRQIAYRWGSDKPYSVTTRIVSVDSGNVRILVDRSNEKSGESLWVWPGAWSPDGKSIAADIWDRKNRTVSIGLVSVADGSFRILKDLGMDTQMFCVGGFSPDGKHLVYQQPPTPSAPHGGIHALSVDRGADTLLVEGIARESMPRWAPDGTKVVFVSQRSGTADLWAIGVVDGKPQGEPVRLKQGLGEIRGLAIARDGTVFYNTFTEQSETYLARFDPQSLKLTSKPAPLSNQFVGSNGAGKWSPDGTLIAFIRTLSGSLEQIVIRSVTTGQETTVPPTPGYNSDLIFRDWFPDGRHVMATAWAGLQMHVLRVDIRTGAAQSIFDGPGRETQNPRLSPDGRYLYYSLREPKADNGSNRFNRLVRRNLDTGEETVLYRAESPGVAFFAPAVSPDGNRIAFLSNLPDLTSRALLVTPAAGGETKVVLRGAYHEIGLNQGWTRDGKHIVYRRYPRPGDNAQLAVVSADGGEPRAIGVEMESLWGPQFSLDGKQMMFAGSTPKRELWTIKNLFTETRAAK